MKNVDANFSSFPVDFFFVVVVFSGLPVLVEPTDHILRFSVLPKKNKKMTLFRQRNTFLFFIFFPILALNFADGPARIFPTTLYRDAGV